MEPGAGAGRDRGPHASPRCWKGAPSSQAVGQGSGKCLHLAAGGAGTRLWGRVRGGRVSIRTSPRLHEEPPGSQHLARWAPDVLGWKPWGCLLAGPSRDDVGGERRPARPGERGRRPVCTWRGWEGVLGPSAPLAPWPAPGPELAPLCLARACQLHCTPAAPAPGTPARRHPYSARRLGAGAEEERKPVWSSRGCLQNWAGGL